MASKTPSAKRAGSAPPVLEKNRRPDMLKPRKDIWKKDIGKKTAGSSISGAAMPALPRPAPFLHFMSAMPAPPPPPSFVLFMLDFMKSKECESVVIKAAEDEWNSMSEAEKGPYERKALEMRAGLDKAVKSYKMMMNARKETPAAAPPTEEELSEAATTGGSVEQ